MYCRFSLVGSVGQELDDGNRAEDRLTANEQDRHFA
jgi:hypothetical protein